MLNKIKLAFLGAILALTAACGGMTSITQIDGDRVQGEIARSAGGLLGDDVTTGVIDYANRDGEWRSQDFLVTSTSFAKMISVAVVPGALVGAIQSNIARYQTDNQCSEACGDIYQMLSQSSSQTLTQVQVDAVSEIMSTSS